MEKFSHYVTCVILIFSSGCVLCCMLPGLSRRMPAPGPYQTYLCGHRPVIYGTHASVWHVGQHGQSAFIHLYDLLRDTSCRTEYCINIDMKLQCWICTTVEQTIEWLLFYFSWVYNYKYYWSLETVTMPTTTSWHGTTGRLTEPQRTTRGNVYPHRVMVN